LLENYHGLTQLGFHIEGHFVAKSTAHKILRSSFYWPTIFIDSYKYVQRCKDYQQVAGNEKFHALPLFPIIPEFPFSKWGLNFIRPINPPSFACHIFILTTTDYFTKWLEVVPLKKVHDEQVINFLENIIFSCFGFPLELV